MKMQDLKDFEVTVQGLFGSKHRRHILRVPAFDRNKAARLALDAAKMRGLPCEISVREIRATGPAPTLCSFSSRPETNHRTVRFCKELSCD
jgi:hypothetical protein